MCLGHFLRGRCHHLSSLKWTLKVLTRSHFGINTRPTFKVQRFKIYLDTCNIGNSGHSTSIWVSLYFLTSWPLFPMIYLIFKIFDLFRSWPLQKRSKTKVKVLWFLTSFVKVKNERGQTFWKINKSLGKEVKRSKNIMKNLKQKIFLKNLK